MIRYPSIFTRGALVLVTSFSMLAACTSPSPTPIPSPTEISITPIVVVPFTPGPQEIPLPTLLPTVEIPASPIPITVAPDTSAIPSVTAVAGSATVARQPTRVPATHTPNITATPFPEGMPRVYVTAMRVDPPTPNPNTPGTFFVTFRNTTAENLGYRWAVEIWREDERRPFGLTAPVSSKMPPGETVVTATGWAPRGQGECVFFRAKAVALDDDDNRSDFIQPNGTPLWLDFNVCP